MLQLSTLKSFSCSRKKQDDEIANTTDMAKVEQKHKELDNDLMETIRQYQNYSELYTKTAYEVQLKRQALEAFTEAIKMFEEQMKLQERFQKEAQPHEISTWVFPFPVSFISNLGHLPET